MTKLVPTWYMLLALFASTFMLAVGGIVYTNWAIARERAGSERRQCEVFTAEVEYYAQVPPDTERGRARLAYYQGKINDYCSE